MEVEIDKENDTITLYAKGLENNTEYKFEWDITYTNNGTAQHEKGDTIKTIPTSRLLLQKRFYMRIAAPRLSLPCPT